jgi:hypothetical protein
MYKKITGVSEETIREHMRVAKFEFKSVFARVEKTKE